MEAITVYNRQEIAPAQQFNTGLFNDFVAWIDRSEKTTRSYLTNLRQFMAWLKYAAVVNPIRQDIISYREWLTAEHEAIALDPGSVNGWTYRTDATGNPLKIVCKPNTVAQYLRSVCQFFRWTAANNLYPDIAANIHAPKVKNETHRKAYLNAKEVLTIEESIAERAQERQQAAQEAQKDTAGRMQRSTEQGKRLYAMYLLAVNAGLRTVEISRANIKDLETKGGQTWLYIWGKGRTEPDQKKPIAPEVATAIKDYLQSRTDHPTTASPLFVSTGNRSGGKRIATTTISTMLKQAMKEAGFDSERITAHSLRHSAAQAALQASGNNIYTAQKYLRHSSPATTEIYLHEDERTEKAERAIAQEVYNLYHGTGADNRAKLEQLINRMTPQQLEQLTGIAAAMA
jgi:integrase/recombinase XerD